MNRTDFENRVLESIENFHMLDMPRNGDSAVKARNIVVGFSGGADSTALLYSLYTLREKLGINLYAAHINHGIRGGTALRDQCFCEEFCSRLGIGIDVYSYDVPALARERGTGLEECGRNCRYEAFEKTASLLGGAKIATAHTLSDSCETVLFNIARGCGLPGLTGIPPVRGNIIRPLIALAREDIESYCSAAGLEYMTDETNTDTVYTRNLIRNEIIPAFRRINPDFSGAVGRMSGLVSEDLEYLESSADTLYKRSETTGGLDAPLLRSAGKALSFRAVIRFIKEKTGKTPEYRHVSALWGYIADCRAGAVELSKLYTARVSAGRLYVTGSTQAARVEKRWQLPFAEGKTVLPDGRILHAAVFDKKKYDENVKNLSWLFKNALDYDIIQRNIRKEHIVVRNRREGDRIALAGRHCTSKIKKLLCDAHIPAGDRENIVLLEADGRVIWLEGFGCAEGLQPVSSTGRVLYIEIT